MIYGQSYCDMLHNISIDLGGFMKKILISILSIYSMVVIASPTIKKEEKSSKKSTLSKLRDQGVVVVVSEKSGGATIPADTTDRECTIFPKIPMK